MKLIHDRAAQSGALNTIRELIQSGHAGLDCYDRDIFVVDPFDQAMRDHADIALDVLGGEMIRDGAYGTPKSMLQCRLPRWVRAELELDRLGAPEIVVPLASRALDYRTIDPDAAAGSFAAASVAQFIGALEMGSH